MKKYLLAIAFFFPFLTSKSQSIGFINPTSQVEGTLASLGPLGELVAEWHVQNISDSFIEVRARRNVISAVQGSTNYFCWGVCFTETTNVSPMSQAQDMNPNQINTSFYAHYKPQGNAGVTTIEYCFFNAANEADQTCQTVQYCVDAACIVGIEETSNDIQLGEVSPNPVKTIASIPYTISGSAKNAKFVVYDMVGKVVKESALSNKSGMILINGVEFETGVYLYTIIADGKSVSTKRMIVSHS